MRRDENFDRTLTIPRAEHREARPAPGHPAHGWTCTEYRGQDSLTQAQPMRELSERAQAQRVAEHQQSWIDAALGTDAPDLVLVRDAWGAEVAAYLLAELPGRKLLVREHAITGDDETQRRVAAIVLRRISEHLAADDAEALVVRGAAVETMLNNLGWRTCGYAGAGHHVWAPPAAAK